ncbi:lipoyl(octanoyl) transferase LipB [Marinagarivorans algicola]|uniref:lipoyl(octanoyl) transferase LipB n=1 Tax=Marinagarivorans algicola TaxID=1513270 RepID=UPI0006B53055|nr:lipoyl(octanoyl) transferase LipB [Marinagarivorans algicola]
MAELSSDNLVRTPAIVKDLGVMEYSQVWSAMRDFTAQRDADTQDEIWCVEHLPVYTQGQAGKPEHILNSPSTRAIPVVQTDRGGQVTYHGPGQLVVYPLLDLKRKKLGVRELVTKIENSVVACLAELGIDAAAKADAPGVYVADAKIASLGLRVRGGCSFHGVGINVAMDLSPFLGINPCGYAAMPMTQIVDVLPHDSTLAPAAFFERIKKQYVACLLAQLQAYAV